MTADGIRWEPLSTAFTVTGRRWVNLNGSRGGHHAYNARMLEWKDRAIIAIRAAKCEPVTPPVTITATVRRTRNARQDAHNVLPTIKAAIDAAVACRLIEDDHDGILKRLVIEAGPKASVPTVEITIEHEETS
jgi:hypothetical protein